MATDITIPFFRRSRIAGENWPDSGDILLGEEEELYELDVIDPVSGVVKRKLSREASANGSVIQVDFNKETRIVYKAADQTADFPSLVSGVFEVPIANSSFEDWYVGRQLVLEANNWTSTLQGSKPTFGVIRSTTEYHEPTDTEYVLDWGVRGTTPNDGINYMSGIGSAARLWQDINLDGYVDHKVLDASSGITATWNLYATTLLGVDQLRLSLVYLTRAGLEIGRDVGNWQAFTEKVWTPVAFPGTIPPQTRIIRLQAEGRSIDPDSIADIGLDGPMSLEVQGIAKGMVGDLYQLGAGGLRGLPARIYF